MTHIHHRTRSARPFGVVIVAVAFLLSASHQALAKTKVPSKQTQSNSTTQFKKPAKKPVLSLLGKPAQSVIGSMFKNGFAEINILNPESGQLAYTFTTDPKKDNSFLNIHRMVAQFENLQQKRSQSVTTYPFIQPGSDEGFRPKYSPDGRYILFRVKASQMAEIETYRLYVLDVQTNVVKRVTGKEIAYDEVSWSPDGKYLVYVQGGDWQGETKIYTSEATFYTGPLKLYVCEWRTGKEQLVTTNDTVGGPFSWLVPHTLIYGALSEPKQVVWQKQRESSEKTGQSKPSTNPKDVPPRPDVYEYSVEEQSSRLLIQDAYLPFPSSDGQWIAFYGSENPDKPFPLRLGWQQEAQDAALCIVKRDGSGRVALNRETGFYPLIRWLPDNRHLLAIQPTKDSPDAEAEIKDWDTQAGSFRLVTTLHAKDFTEIPLTFLSPKFRPLQISQDGTKIYISKSENIGRVPGHSLSVVLKSLQSVDLATGEVTTIAELKNVYSIDWSDKTINSNK